MFKDCKYTRWYFSIVDLARTVSPQGYTEKHHVIPKSLGGDNSKRNIVRLTPRQHFICHILLTRMTTGKQRQKMCLALHLMLFATKTQSRSNKLASSTFEKLRIERAEIMRTRKMSEDTRSKISIALTGKKQTPEHIEACRKSRIGIKLKESTKQKISNSLCGKMSHWTDDRKQKISAALKGKRHKLQLSEKQRIDRSEKMKQVWANRRSAKGS